jgi:HD-like signal output (HDOD) protein
MTFAEGSKAAVEHLNKAPFDVVVTDMHMPGMDGLALLSEVKLRTPNAVRIILSGTVDREFILRSVGIAHQFLAKPCNSAELKATVQRTFALRDLLADERLAQVTAKLTSLPPLPSLYLEIQRVLSGPPGSIEDLGKIVAKDIAMSARVLQLANSAFFGASRPFTSAVEATVYLGLDIVTALVLTSQVFTPATGLQPETLQSLWAHSLQTGAFARAILKLESQDPRTADQAFLAGVLHEVGLLVFSAELPEKLAQAWKYARRFGLPVAEAERRVIGASRATVGAYLMGIWGLQATVVEAIAFHQTPNALPHDGILPITAVHVAAGFASGDAGYSVADCGRTLDMAYLERLGLADRPPLWRKECARLLGAHEAA